MKSRTTTPKLDNNTEWYFYNAEDQVLGRLASEIAQKLIGKNKAHYTNHLNVGGKVVVVNAAKVKITGKKLTDKIYKKYTGYPGAVKKESLGHLMERMPTEALRRAVKGMLPKNKLQKVRMANLYIYEDDKNPHAAHTNASKKGSK